MNLIWTRVNGKYNTVCTYIWIQWIFRGDLFSTDFKNLKTPKSFSFYKNVLHIYFFCLNFRDCKIDSKNCIEASKNYYLLKKSKNNKKNLLNFPPK